MEDVKLAARFFFATLPAILGLTFVAGSLPWWAGITLLLVTFFGVCYGLVKWVDHEVL